MQGRVGFLHRTLSWTMDYKKLGDADVESGNQSSAFRVDDSKAPVCCGYHSSDIGTRIRRAVIDSLHKQFGSGARDIATLISGHKFGPAQKSAVHTYLSQAPTSRDAQKQLKMTTWLVQRLFPNLDY